MPFDDRCLPLHAAGGVCAADEEPAGSAMLARRSSPGVFVGHGLTVWISCWRVSVIHLLVIASLDLDYLQRAARLSQSGARRVGWLHALPKPL
jgi:pyridoxal biosynthesis lyase PdxS